ncbi:MAG: M48 family metalloprotease [Novosphingobium sp.]
MIHLVRSFSIVLAPLALAACSGATVSDAERRLGAEQHPRLLAEFGGAYLGDEAAYLAKLGARLAAAGELDGSCTFTLINSDVVNAFAVPGCYIYVTRGLMAIVNSEAELASVLAHELGHIARDHSERQERRSIWRSLGVMAIGAITGSAELSDLASTAATYFTLRYSRTHEYEADDFGLKTLEAVGYDPHAAPDMLAALERQQAYQQRVRGADEARSIPEWALTHPLTQNRIRRARAAAEEASQDPNALPENEAAFLRVVDGLLYGDDPQQGFVVGRRFAHPVMRIGFEAPAGFTLTNSPQAILIEGPGQVRGEFSGGPLPSRGLEAYAEAVLGQTLGDAPFDVVSAVRTRAHGVPALIVTATVATPQGAVPVSLAAYATGEAEAYHFLMVSPPSSAPPAAFGALFRSFAVLSAEQIAALRPRILRVRTVRPGETSRTLAARMASERPLEHFLMLNGRTASMPLRPGERVKLIEWDR